jgi:hypothetical protein
MAAIAVVTSAGQVETDQTVVAITVEMAVGQAHQEEDNNY